MRAAALINTVLSFSWIYHGLIPKLLYPDSGELELLQRSGFFTGYEDWIVRMTGVMEIIFGLILLLFRRKWLHYLNIILLIILASGAIIADPALLTKPFNPLTLNISLIALSAVALVNYSHLRYEG